MKTIDIIGFGVGLGQDELGFRIPHGIMKIFIIILTMQVGGLNELLAGSFLPPHSLGLPVLITLPNVGSGSGFFIATSNHIFLATAAHVLFAKNTTNLLCNQADISWYDDYSTNSHHSEMHLNLEALQTNNEIRIHGTHDVAVVRLCVINDKGQDVYDSRKIQVPSTYFNPVMVQCWNVQKLSAVSVGDDVYVLGYPSSVGLQQLPKFDYSRPLLRKGIVSGIYSQTQTIIIDAALYWGNSGGPIVEKNVLDNGQTSFTVIGIATDIIPFVDIWENKRYEYANINFSNSGYAVVEPVDFILELLWDN